MLVASHRPGRNLTEVTVTETSVILRSEYGHLRLMEMENGILRVTFTRRDAFADTPSPYLINRTVRKPVRIDEDSRFLYVHTAGLCARVSMCDGVLETFDRAGNALFRENGLRTLEAFDAQVIDRTSAVELEHIQTADGVKTRVREAQRRDYKSLFRARLPFVLDAGEAIYGFGQPEKGSANLRGRRLYLCQMNRSIALPFFVSTAGYGLLTDCGCPFIFDGTAENAAFLYYSAVEELDYYVIPGDCESVVKGYHQLTGKPALLPTWAFGYIQSQERYESADELLAVTRQYRNAGIGLDAIVLDWCSWPDGQWGQKEFDRTRFPDPTGLTAQLHALDTRLMVSIWPNTNPRTANNAEMKAAGHLLPGGALYDALDPCARALYWRQAKEGLFDSGVDAWWCDSSEPWTSEWSHEEKPEDSEVYCETCRTAADAIGADNGNAYAFYHALTMWEGQRSVSLDRRVTNLTRSAWLGQQRLGTILWSGDISAGWDTLRQQIAVGLDMSASGMPYWTQDIGGFFVKKGKPWYWDGQFDNGWADPEYRELFVRWYEYAVFLPIFRGHGTDIRRELTNLEGQEYAAVLRHNALRYRLLPYIYSLAGLLALEGGTLMKPLGFRYPNDITAVNTDDEFLFGDNLLICPVTAYGARSRDVWLPEDDWYELATGIRTRGGRYRADAPLDTLPVFIKAGTVLPVVGAAGCAREAFAQTPVYWVFPGRDGMLRMYSDAGDGYGYENGEYTLRTFFWKNEEKALVDEKGNRIPYRIFTDENRRNFYVE